MELGLNQESEIEQANIVVPSERAQFADRFFASIVDGVIVNTPLRLIQIFLIKSLPLLFAVTVSVYVWYFAYYPYTHNGQTFGKKWLRMKMVRLDGNNLSFGHLVVREIAKSGIVFISSLIFGTFGYLIGLSTFLLALTNNRLALHDIIARTQVIKVKL